jgi:mannose-6-phosphate isomerase-like protein (cupin superfamily)
MARVLTAGEGKRLGLPGRTAMEIVSGETGTRAVTLRLVEIAVPKPGEMPRGPHLHRAFEECMYVLSGTGICHTDKGQYPVRPGDTILMPAGEKHVTRNTGDVPLMLLCFFPVPDIVPGTEDASFTS